jgi:hypothetical protein
MCPPRLEAVLTDMSDSSGKRQLVTEAAAALILSVVLSWGAVYGLNRYLPDDPPETVGSVRALYPLD